MVVTKTRNHLKPPKTSNKFFLKIFNDVLVSSTLTLGAQGTKIFVVPGEHGFFFFQVKMFTGSVSVLLTSTSLKIKKLKLAEATRETEHRSAMHSAPSTEV